jgi:hypothetical protein
MTLAGKPTKFTQAADGLLRFPGEVAIPAGQTLEVRWAF